MIFKYQALNKDGDTITDFVDSTSESSARQKIRELGHYIVSIKKHDVAPDKSTHHDSKIKHFAEQILDIGYKRKSKKEIGLFSRQLATLLKAGLPLPTAINDIIDQLDNKYFKNIIIDVKEKIEEGSSFSNALLRHKFIFSDMYINMVRVGENLGSLDIVIERLAELEEKGNMLKGKIQAALWYPAFMLFFSSIVILFLLVNVIPRITEIFADQKKDLPLPTEIVIALSNFLSVFWYFIPLLILGGIYFYKKYEATDEGKKKIDEIKMKIPLIKNLYKKLIVLKFTQNLGILLSNKVDLIKSFEIVGKIVGNVIVEEKIEEAGKKIKEGSSVANALKKSEFLPKLVMGMISAGESSDNLDTMLVNIGNVYETEIDLTVTSLTGLIEPLIIVFMGIAIGVIVMAVMLPIMEMNMLM